MAKNHETGHAKNVANFSWLIDYCVGYGTAYNPAKTILQLPALQALLAQSQAVINAVAAYNQEVSVAINARRAAFSTLNKYSLRLVNSLKSGSDATPAVMENARSFRRKIQGIRAKDLKNQQPAEGTVGTQHNTISVSQVSYSNLVEHFNGLNLVLINEPSYETNITDLKTASVTAFINDLRAKNNTVNAANVVADNSRITRNNILYKTNLGLYDIAQKVKSEIKSIFGQDSAEYKLVAKINFKSQAE